MCEIDNIVIATVYDVISFSNDENIYSVDLYHYMYYYSRWLEKCNFQAIIFLTEPFFAFFFRTGKSLMATECFQKTVRSVVLKRQKLNSVGTNFYYRCMSIYEVLSPTKFQLLDFTKIST